MLLGMLVLTSGLQMLSTGLNVDSDSNNEFNRQKGICDQITNTKTNISNMDNLLSALSKDKSLADKTSNDLLTMSQDIGSNIASFNSLKTHYTQKLLIMIVINIIIVSFLSIYILNKVD